MNWTGGGLQRHTGNSRSLTKQQRAHFAKVRSSRHVPASHTISDQHSRRLESCLSEHPHGLNRSQAVQVQSSGPLRPAMILTSLDARHGILSRAALAGTDPRADLDAHKQRLLDAEDWLGLQHTSLPSYHKGNRTKRRDHGRRKRRRLLSRDQHSAILAVPSPVRTHDISLRVGPHALQTSPCLTNNLGGELGKSQEHWIARSDGGSNAAVLSRTRTVDNLASIGEAALPSDNVRPIGHEKPSSLAYLHQRQSQPTAELSIAGEVAMLSDWTHLASNKAPEVGGLMSDAAISDLLNSSLFSPRIQKCLNRSSSIPLPSLNIRGDIPPGLSEDPDDDNNADEDLFAPYEVRLITVPSTTATDAQMNLTNSQDVEATDNRESKCSTPLVSVGLATCSDEPDGFNRDQSSTLFAGRQSRCGSERESDPEAFARGLEETSRMRKRQPYNEPARSDTQPMKQLEQSTVDWNSVTHPSLGANPAHSPAARPLSRNTQWAKFVFGADFPCEMLSEEQNRTLPQEHIDHRVTNKTKSKQDLDSLSLAPMVSSSDQDLTQRTYERDRMSTVVERDRHRETELSSIWGTQRYQESDEEDARVSPAQPRVLESDVVELSGASSPMGNGRNLPGGTQRKPADIRWWRRGKAMSLKDRGKKREEAIEISSQEEDDTADDEDDGDVSDE